MSKRLIKEQYCGNKHYLQKDNKEYLDIRKEMKEYRSYFTHYNGARPYLCYIKKDNVYIYKINENNKIRKYDHDDNKNKWMYTKLVKYYKTLKIFIGFDTGKSFGSDLGNFKGSRKFSLGNTILLKISKNIYVFIEG